MSSIEPSKNLIDQRGIPSNECINCGSTIQIIRAVFQEYQLVLWFTDSFCAGCGSPMTTPTPVDNPDYQPGGYDDDLG
jgi:hypothetical protein